MTMNELLNYTNLCIPKPITFVVSLQTFFFMLMLERAEFESICNLVKSFELKKITSSKTYWHITAKMDLSNILHKKMISGEMQQNLLLY